MSEPKNHSAVYDVVVVGGGVAGTISAIAAARCGASTLVIEEQGFLGGSLTGMGVGPMMSFHNAAGTQVVRGLPEELVCRLMKRGASPGHIPDSTTYCSTVTPFNAEELKIELESMLEEAGGKVLFHTQLAGVTCKSKRVQSVLVCNKAGLTEFGAGVYIDGSGDGDLAARAGVPFHHGRKGDSATQPMTMNLKLAQVDIAAVRRYVQENPEDFSWVNGATEGLRRMQTSPCVSLAGYKKAWAEARASGEVDVPRDVVLFFETATAGVVIVNTSRILGLNPTDPFDLSKAEQIGRIQCRQIHQFLKKRCPGFEKAIRVDSASKIGVRESRHIEGEYTLTADDIIEGREFEDRIAWGGYPIDIHSPDGEKTHTREVRPSVSYQIPLRCLLVPQMDNLVTVGRCISATHEAAAAIRVTPIAMAIGHAGGVAAAMAKTHHGKIRDVPLRLIQETLREQGAHLP
jgi:hypothetical protein